MAFSWVILFTSASGHAVEVLHRHLRGLGPGGVGVGVVALPGDVVDVHVLGPARHPEGVVDEAGDDPLAEHLTGQHVAEVLTGPRLVVGVDVVDPLQEVRDPADAALRQRQPQVGELPQHGREEEVRRALDDVHGRQRDQHVEGRVGGGHDDLRRRADVHAHHRPLVRTGRPERVPVVAVDARPPELGRVLGEGHGVASLGRHPAHLGRHDLGVPDGGDGQRDEAARVGAAPRLDVPVVVGLQHGERQVLVLRPGEELPAELDERGEAHRSEHAVHVHVPDPLVDVVAAGPHLGERGGLDAVLLGGPSHDGVQPDVGDLVALVGPDVDPAVLVDDPRGAVLPLGRHPALEHVGRLDDMVVDTHEDEILCVHGAPPSCVVRGGHRPRRRSRVEHIPRPPYLTSASGKGRATVVHWPPDAAPSHRTSRPRRPRPAAWPPSPARTPTAWPSSAGPPAPPSPSSTPRPTPWPTPSPPPAAGPGDRVAIMLDNSVELFAAWYGAARRGALVVPVSTRLTAPEAAYIVADSGAIVLVHAGSAAAAGHLTVSSVPVAGLDVADPSLLAPVAGPLGDDYLGTPVVTMSYTSGTTGRPKGITRAAPPPCRDGAAEPLRLVLGTASPATSI